MVRVSRGEAFSGPAAVAWAALVLVFAIFSSSTTAEARLSVSTVGYTYDSAATRAATTTVPSTGLAALGIPPSSEALGCVYDSPKNPVATNTARSGSQLVDDSLQGLQAGRFSGVRVVDSADELDDLFRQLSVDGTPVSGTTYPGKMVELPDGTTVGIRTTSVSGGPTIDIKLPNGNVLKVHVNQ